MIFSPIMRKSNLLIFTLTGLLFFEVTWNAECSNSICYFTFKAFFILCIIHLDLIVLIGIFVFTF